MKLLACSIAGLCLCLVGSTAARAWEAFTPKDCGFTVELPREPQHDEMEIPSDDGELLEIARDAMGGAEFNATFDTFLSSFERTP